MALAASASRRSRQGIRQANAAKPYQPDLVLAYFQALVQNHQFPEAEKLARDLIAKSEQLAPIYNAALSCSTCG